MPIPRFKKFLTTNNFIKNICFLFILWISLGSGFVYAQNLPQLPPLVPGVLQNYYTDQPLRALDVVYFLISVRNFLLYAGIVLIIIMLALAGLQMLTARGNEKGVQDAKNTLRWTVIAAIVILATYAIFSAIIAVSRLSFT